MFFLYVVFFFLILRFTVTLFNFISNPKLTPGGKHYTDLVSILIPPSTDEDDILPLLASIREQDYKNYEVLIGKSTLCALRGPAAKLVRAEPRIRLVDVSESYSMPSNHNALLNELSAAARGNYILHPTKRSAISDGLINNVIHRMKLQQLALLELSSNQIMLTLGERMVVPLINYLLLSLIPLRLIRLSDSAAFAISCGQFRAFNAQIYQQYRWHSLISQKGTGTDLMKLVKSYGYHAEVLLANKFLHTRMYTGFKDAVLGLSNTIISSFGSLAALLVYLFMVIAGPAAMAVYLDIELVSFAVTLIVLSRIMISLATGENAWLNVLLHPLQIAAFLMICLIALYKQFTESVTRKQRNMGY